MHFQIKKAYYLYTYNICTFTRTFAYVKIVPTKNIGLNDFSPFFYLFNKI